MAHLQERTYLYVPASQGDEVLGRDPNHGEGREVLVDWTIHPKIQATWNFLSPQDHQELSINTTGFVYHCDAHEKKRVDVEVLSALMLPGAGVIYSEKAFDQLGQAKFVQHPVTSGPFMIKAWIEGAGAPARPRPLLLE